VPFGSVIVQDAPNLSDTTGTPILRFVNRDTRDVLIERLGFTWTVPQEPPPGWVQQDARLPQPAAYAAPGAVAILFAAGARNETEGAYYQITIRECRFERGWRGIAIDDTYDLAPISVWDTHIDRCSFHGLRGAAVSLVNYASPKTYIGMPANAIRGCFIENYSNPDGEDMGVEFSRRNVEPQVRLAAQTNMRIDGLDAEGSKTTVLYAADSQIVMSALYLEHLKIGYPLSDNGNPMGDDGAPYAQVLGLYGGEYSLDGLHLDGTINAYDEDNQRSTFSQVIYATAGASVTVGNVRARPLLNPGPTTLDTAPGFHIEKGDTRFFHTNAFGGGALARLRTVGALHLEASSRTANKLVLFDGSLDAYTTPDAVAARVEREPRAVRVTLSFPTIPAGRTRTPTSPPPPEPARPESSASEVLETVPSYPGARVGDLVRVAPPAGFPAGCLAQGVVTATDTVEVRVFNSGTAAATVPSGVWTVEYGRGANGALLPTGS
jgi:hypothetical protein